MRHLAWITVWVLVLPACAGSEVLDSSEPDPSGQSAETTPIRPPGSQASPDSLPPPSTVRPKAPSVEPTVVPAEPGRLDIAGLEQLTALAISNLAERLEVPTREISVLEGELVAWPDTSFGCPEPGRSYAQVVSSGSLILLDHAGTIYRYHSGGDDPRPFLCDPDDGTS